MESERKLHEDENQAKQNLILHPEDDFVVVETCGKYLPSNMEQVYSYLPNQPKVLYKTKCNHFVMLEYNAILQCVVVLTRLNKAELQEDRDEVQKTMDHLHYSSAKKVKDASVESSSKRVHWTEPPKLILKQRPRLYFPFVKYKYGVFSWERNSFFLVAVFFDSLRFLGLSLFLWWAPSQTQLSLGLLSFEVILLAYLRVQSMLWATFRNKASFYQILLAFLSPMYWSMSFSGGPARNIGQVYRSPLWKKIILSLVLLLAQIMGGLQTESSVFLASDVVAAALGTYGGLSSARILFNEIFNSPRVVQISPEFLLSSTACHFHGVVIQFGIMVSAGNKSAFPLILCVISCFEFFYIIPLYLKLEEIFLENTVFGRLKKAYDVEMNVCGITVGKILAGIPILIDFHRGVDDTKCEEYVTWITRQNGTGRYRLACMLLSNKYRDCKLVQKRVAWNDFGESVHVVSIQGHGPKSGEVSLALGPVLKSHFRDSDDFKQPSTKYNLKEDWFMRAFCGGIIGFPIM